MLSIQRGVAQFTLALALLGTVLQVTAAPRTLDTANGPITLEGQPQRVVTLDETALDVALSVGIQPVGTLATRGGTEVAPYLTEHLQDKIAIVGSVREPNLEAILRLKPDLILAPANFSAVFYDKLAKIAPTIQPKGSSLDTPWQDLSRVYAQALDQEAELDLQLNKIAAALQSYRQQHAAPLKVSVLRWNPQGPIIMSSQLFAGQMLREAGLHTIALADRITDKPHSDTLSLENLTQADGDWIFLATLNAEGQQALEQAKQQSAFQRLTAVKNNHLLAVDGQVWSSGSGPLAAQVVLQDLQRLADHAEH